MVPAEGFEPPTNGLQNRCSTTELSRPAGRLERAPLVAIVGAASGVKAACVRQPGLMQVMASMCGWWNNYIVAAFHSFRH